MLQLQYKQESQGGNLEAGDNPSPSRGGGQGKMTGYTIYTMSGSDKCTNEMLIQEREMLSQS